MAKRTYEETQKIAVRARSTPWSAGIEILVQGHSFGKRCIGTNVVFEEQKEGFEIQPTLRIDRDQAQCLMDDLWNAGLRPTEGTGSAGALAATQNHLTDMRRLVFDHALVMKEPA